MTFGQQCTPDPSNVSRPFSTLRLSPAEPAARIISSALLPIPDPAAGPIVSSVLPDTALVLAVLVADAGGRLALHTYRWEIVAGRLTRQQNQLVDVGNDRSEHLVRAPAYAMISRSARRRREGEPIGLVGAVRK